ncbi:transcription factor with AP2 domain(s) [Plasmodium gonderi]|uniref:Transcription factor with AP2 domain(S) n=1 Tax=Plasmodium gonderi TaxID=77519 RepID=A0A1Y1JJ62_PLAGO|nr:transcription factor with AP2 domain(s) [Plasmodium gonderi]GAW82526.1 transcription factor with AP2 domain(s) [Plasmodium gonderi]
MSSGDSLSEDIHNEMSNNRKEYGKINIQTNNASSYNGNVNQDKISKEGLISSDSEIGNPCEYNEDNGISSGDDIGNCGECYMDNEQSDVPQMQQKNEKCKKSKSNHKYKADKKNFDENENRYIVPCKSAMNEYMNYETSIILDEQTNNTHSLGNTMTLDDGDYLKETNVNKIINTENETKNKNYKVKTVMTESIHDADNPNNLPNDNGLTTIHVSNNYHYPNIHENIINQNIREEKSRFSNTDDENEGEEFSEKNKENKGKDKNIFACKNLVGTNKEVVYDEDMSKDKSILRRRSSMPSLCRSKSEEILRVVDSTYLKSEKEDSTEKYSEGNANVETEFERKQHMLNEEENEDNCCSENIDKIYEEDLRRCLELNNLTRKKVHMELFLHHQINCYDLLLEIRKKIPIWGEYEANFYFHWKKIMTICIEELKIYILIFRSLSIGTVKHLDFFMLKIIIEELDELRKVHEPNYKPFTFTQECLNYSDYANSYEQNPDIYVNMNKCIQPWYVKNFNKSMDIKKFLNSLDILENQKHKSYIIQAMEIPNYIFDLCDMEEGAESGAPNGAGSSKEEPAKNKMHSINRNIATNDAQKKVKKTCKKKKENQKMKSLNTSINSKPKKRTGHYDLEIDGVVASFEARKGVYYDKSRKLWRANWKENGKIQTKGFSVNEYKSVQLARQKAIEWREKKEAELLL